MDPDNERYWKDKMDSESELMEDGCDCIMCCPNGHCECEDCEEPCDALCIEETSGESQ